MHRLQRGIEGALGSLTDYQQAALAVVTFIGLPALAVVTSIGVVVTVAMRAALAALRTRYPRRMAVAGSLLLVHAVALVLLALAGQRGFGLETLADALVGATVRLVVAATVLATVYLLWRSLAEGILTPAHVCGAVLVSTAFGAAWVTLLVRVAGVPLTATDAVWMLSPALLPLAAGVLAPWSLSRIRHT